MSFFSNLTRRVKEVDSLLCVGLDPHPSDISSQTATAVREFCFRLINATAECAALYKPNIAFFEAYGPEGISALQQVITHIPKEIPVLMDAKRGDIASTAEAYAKAVFQVLGASAVTINPYIGHDALEPFLTDPERGVFLLCKTSNPGAADLQDLLTTLPGSADQYTLYERVALLAQNWNISDNLGLVVGATQPEALERVRRLVPDMWILAPGVGLQGGNLQRALQAGLRSDGLGMIIPISRGISRSAEPKEAAQDIRKKINLERKNSQVNLRSFLWKKEEKGQIDEFALLADGLLEAGCIKFGQFTLKSGLNSPIYIDLRQLVTYPRLLEQVAKTYLPILKELNFNRIAGLPYAALPIATAISLQSGWPLIYPRKEVKTYGTKAEIEGVYINGEQVVVIDDLATTGGSKIELIDKLLSVGLTVKDIVVLIDRQSGAAELLASAGYKLHAVATLTNLLDYYENSNKVSTDQIASARNFLNSTP